ncbi:Ger(x)C family spore germination protein [Paenibacillus sp. XY044]|uniref:Ger(x)C family spore germination protein n=1 Tax=Paenibacillus sp. XY044 TaxID=2026089 RepID=UPI000B97ED16|nr:Ger(x)C family spore germination protein [Paenibacillus sp. XY044]OZB96666.1 hypothetical protein CJP46_12425 [Paenibacillus sp. XY044]
MSRRAARYLAILCMLLFLPGCWDVKDIDNRLLVTAIGIEPAGSDRVQVWMRFPLPQSQDGAHKDFFVIRQEGGTVIEAIDQLRLRLPKSLDMSQNQSIFLDQALAKKGFMPYLEFTIRDRTVPLDTLIAVTTGGMKSIFERSNPTGELSGTYTKLFFERYAGGTSQKNVVSLWEIFKGYYNPLEECLVPVLAADSDTLFRVAGNAYFKHDTMLGMISPEETLIYEIISGKMSPFEIETAEKMNLKILDSSANIDTDMKNGKPVIRIHAKLTMTLMDSARGIDIKAKHLEASINRLIEQRANKVFRLTQEKESDIFGLGNRYRGKIPPDQYNRWPKLYSGATLEFKLDSELKNTGLQLRRRPFINPSKDE